MAREHLAGRANWQGKSAARGQGAEDVFHTIMDMHLEQSELTTEHKPKNLQAIYGERIAGNRTRPHGIHPEYVIRNQRTNRAIFVEIKRQRAEGNAHERACKYMMPGILASVREIAGQPESVIPFWWIFTNGIAKDKYYRQEITHWFKGIEGHFLLWQNVRERKPVVEHFEKHIRHLLG